MIVYCKRIVLPVTMGAYDLVSNKASGDTFVLDSDWVIMQFFRYSRQCTLVMTKGVRENFKSKKSRKNGGRVH